MPIEIDRQRILARLEEWSRESDDLRERLALYRALLSIEVEYLPQVNPPNPDLTQDEAAALLAQVRPLLSSQNLDMDWQQAGELLKRVVDQATKTGLSAQRANKLRDFGSDVGLLRDAILAWLKEEPLLAIAAGANVDPSALEMAVSAVMKPFLTSFSQKWSALITQVRWHRGCCPACGASPHFAYLEKEKGARWLFCARCDTQWPFHRLECPFCGNQNLDALSYHTDEDGLYRLYLCDNCKGYLKAIDLRQTEMEVLLPLEVVLSTDMDVAAKDMGYQAGKSRRQG